MVVIGDTGPVDGYDETTYGERFADVYDDWYGDITDTDASVDTLERIARIAARDGRVPVVVELGVGTGRLAVPLASRGLQVVGVDASPSMLEVLATKDPDGSVSAVLGDMADPPGDPGSVDLVFVAYNTFFNLVVPGAQERCLDAVKRMLAPDGRFVVEAFVPDVAVEFDGVAPTSVTADRVVLSVVKTRPESRELIGQYVDITEDGISLRPWHIRYATPEQLDEMAAAAGLVLEGRHSDWDGTPFVDGSRTHISRYRPV